MKEKIAVIASENGKAKILEEHEGNISEIVRHIARKALEIWDNEKSDFIIIRDRYPVEINLPITKDEYEVYSKYNLRRTSSKTALFELPVYIISYDNEWREENYKDYKVLIVVPNVGDNIIKEIINWAAEMTLENEEDNI